MFALRVLVATAVTACLLPSVASAQPKLGISGRSGEDGVVVCHV